MNNENEIERMANEIAKVCPDLIEDSCDGVPCVSCLATALVNAGIGDKKQAVKEYIEELCNEFYIDTHLMVNGIDHRRYDCEAIQRAIYAIYDKLYGADE